MPIHPKHILICRNDNIGDVVLTLPITAWLKARFPTVKISFMVRRYAADVVRGCATVDEVLEVETIEAHPVRFFRESGVDTVIFAQPDMALNRKLAKSAFFARVPNRIGNARQKLYMALYCNRRVRFSKRTLPVHESQFNFEFLRPLGLQSVPELGAIAGMYRWKALRDPQVDALLARHGFNLVIHPKSNGHGREWPASHFSELADLLVAEPAVHIWVTGSAKEGEWLQQNAPDLLQRPNVSNLCGKLSLAQLSCLIQHADGLIASGTGPLHLSAALGQRTLGLFPPTQPMHPGRWAPVGPRASYLAVSANCPDCAKLQTPSCACMEEIRPAMVEARVLEWMAQAQAENTPRAALRS
jgi:ADP-heptose:LPS heptosyltransferase